MNDVRIDSIEWAPLNGRRLREARGNAYARSHGQEYVMPIARVTTNEGLTAFGWSRIDRQTADALVGLSFREAFRPNRGVSADFIPLDMPLWDLAGKLADRPVYELLSGDANTTAFRAPCYDTSLLMDDLDLEDDDEAAALIASEAIKCAERGHRSFKIKVGRGAMHMPVQEGLRRDVRVVNAVREALGTEARILIDANNGYTLNLAERMLAETADADIYWIEEPFHESWEWDEPFKTWLRSEGLDVLVADGEGVASEQLLHLAENGLIDVVQYDIFGFSDWVVLGPKLDAISIRTAPHNYAGLYGNCAACHLAAGIGRFEMVEWDEASVTGLDASAYSITDGQVNVPRLPGFGLQLDDDVFQQAVRDRGFTVSSTNPRGRSYDQSLPE